MDKNELADRFGNGTINILVQNYEHSEQGKQHSSLEESNNFGKPNKTLEEATTYQLDCVEKGINRFLVIYETDRQPRDPVPPEKRMKQAFMNKIYDYLKDYLGIQTDKGRHIETTVDENNRNYVFKTLERTTQMRRTKIVVHAPVEMSEQETKEFYDYMQRTAQQYKNVNFLILDRKERGIEKLEGFETIR